MSFKMSSPGGNMISEVPKEIHVEIASLPRKKIITKHPSFWKNAQEYFSEYTSTTGLHGFRYLGEQKRSKFERILWLVIISVSLGTCAFCILKTYEKWDATPVIVTLAHSSMPIWKVPFPAVTVCSDMKMRYFYHKYLKTKINKTESDLKLLKDDPFLCQFPSTSSLTTDEDIFQLLTMAGRSKEEIMTSCVYSSFEDCTTLFSTILTEEGVCYTFNSLNAANIYRPEVHLPSNFLNHQNNVTDWSIEKGYAEFASKNAFPRRTTFTGTEAGLSFFLVMFCPEFKYLCNGTEGFKIVLHHPAELPRVSMQYLTVPYSKEVTLAIKPDLIETSNSLRDYDPHRRGCYFADEKYLLYYKNYTQQNCLTECIANYTLKTCVCVPFYMPRWNTTRICDSVNTPCVYKARREVLTRNAMNEFKKKRAAVGCDCLPSCTALAYNVETSQANSELGSSTSKHKDHVFKRVSKVNIFFKETLFITSKRNELYGVSDFLANCGGILGLFIGFSFMSLMEFFYFLSIRLGINWWRYGRHYWSASADLLQTEMNGHEK